MSRYQTIRRPNVPLTYEVLAGLLRQLGVTPPPRRTRRRKETTRDALS